MMNGMSPEERLSVRFDEDKKEILKKMAKRHNTTLSNLVRITLEKVIKYEQEREG